MKVYKLTNEDDQTYGDTQWGRGITNTAKVAGNRLCSEQVIHCYRDPLLAVLFNPLHANIPKPHLWEAEADEIVADDGQKLGAKTLTTLRRIRIPRIRRTQYIAFAILCALEVNHDKDFVKWAEGWLSSKDRTRTAAWAAWAAWAAGAAARAAEAARAAWAAKAAGAAARAAEAAAWAAEAAEAAAAKDEIDFISIALKAMEYATKEGK